MSGVEDIPVWLAIAVAVLAVLGSLITLLGCIGMLRLRTFYERIHAPTLGTSMGAFITLLASSLFFSVTGGRFVLHEILIFVFVTFTTPVTLMLLARAALHRDRVEDNGVPARRAE